MDTMTDTITLALTALTMILSCIAVLLCALVLHLMKKVLQGNAATTAAAAHLLNRVEAAIEELQEGCSHRCAAEKAEETEAPQDAEEEKTREAPAVGHVSIDLPLDTWSTATPDSPRSWSTEANSEGTVITVLRAPGVPSSPRSVVGLEEFWGIALKEEGGCV